MSDQRRGPPDGELLLHVGGQTFGGWTAVNVTRGIERMPSDFDIRGTGKAPNELRERIKLNQPMRITIAGHVVLTGYVERLVQQIGHEAHTVGLIGRGRCCDLVDTAALLSNSTRSNTSVGVLARELVAPYAGPIEVLTPDGDGDSKTYYFNINLGESPYEIIERVSRFEGLLCYENADGNLVLARIGREKHSSGFLDGGNVEAATVTAAVDERFSAYIPLLMSSDTLAGRNGPSNSNSAGEIVRDAEIDRYRPRIIVSEQNTNEQFLAHQRAVWEAARRRGRGVRINLVCDSWLDSSGTPWTPNVQATVGFKSMGISDVPLVITEVVYRRDGRSGTQAYITLMPPEALSVEPSGLNAQDARLGIDRPAAGGPLGPTPDAPPPTSAPNAAAPGGHPAASPRYHWPGDGSGL